MDLPRALVIEHKKREVRKALRYKRRAARRTGEREAAIWKQAQDKAEWRARRG